MLIFWTIKLANPYFQAISSLLASSLVVQHDVLNRTIYHVTGTTVLPAKEYS